MDFVKDAIAKKGQQEIMDQVQGFLGGGSSTNKQSNQTTTQQDDSQQNKVNQKEQSDNQQQQQGGKYDDYIAKGVAFGEQKFMNVDPKNLTDSQKRQQEAITVSHKLYRWEWY